MRAFIILSLLLAGAASLIAYGVGPMIDTERLRAAIEQTVESGAGLVIKADGGTDITWLPRPRVSLRALEVRSANAALPELAGSIDRVDLALDPISLLLGKIEVDGIRIVRPRLVVPEDGVTDWSRIAVDPRKLAAIDDAILVLGGEVVAASGRKLLENLDLEIERIAETGAVAASGKALSGPMQLGLRADSIVHEESEGGPLTVHLDLEEEGLSLAAAFVGSWSLAAEPISLAGRMEVTSDVDAQAKGQGSAATRPARSARPGLFGQILPPALVALNPFSLSGQFWFEPGRLRLEEGRLRTVFGDADILFEHDRETAPGFDLRIDATRLDLAAVPGGPGEAIFWQDLPSDLVGRVSATGSVVEGGVLGPMNDVALDILLPGGGSIAIERFAAGLPGGGQVRANAARLEEGGEASWSGSARLHVMEPTPSLAGLLERIGIDGANLRTIGLETEFRATPASLALNDLSLAFDASRAFGQILIFRDPAPRLVLGLEIDRLEPARYMAGAWLEESGGRNLDRVFKGLADDVSLSAEIEIGRFQAGAYSASDLRLRIDVADRAVTIKELAIGSLGAARIAALGSMRPDERSFDLAFEIDMPSLSRFLRALGSPTRPMLSLVGPLRGSGVATGTLDDAVIDAAIESEHGLVTLEAEIEGPPDRPRIDARMTAEAPNLATVLRRFAGISRSLDVLEGPMALQMEVTHEAGTAPSSLKVDGDLGLMRLDLDATRAPQPGADDRQWTGRLGLTRLDWALLQDLRRLAPGFIEEDLESGADGWVHEPVFLNHLLPEATSIAWDLDIGLERDGVTLGDLRASLEADADRLSVDLREMPMAGGTLAGSLALASADFEQAARDLDLSLVLRDVTVETLLAPTSGPSPVGATISLELDARSEGGSPHELAANLHGQGQLLASDGEIDVRGPLSPNVAGDRDGTDDRTVLWNSYGRDPGRTLTPRPGEPESPVGPDTDAHSDPHRATLPALPADKTLGDFTAGTASGERPSRPEDGHAFDAASEDGQRTIAFATLAGDFFIADGLALTGDGPLRLEGPAIRAAVDARFDLLGPFLDIAIRDTASGASTTLRLLGPAPTMQPTARRPQDTGTKPDAQDTSD